MTTGRRSDPYGGFRFHMEIDSIIVAGFSEVSGLSVETEVEERREGGVNDYLLTFAKGSKNPRLVMKHGLTDSDVLWAWHQAAVDGRIQRKSGAILLFDIAGNEKWRWTFEGAYPVKWTGPDLKADNNAVAFETVELVHQGIKKG